MNDRDLDSLNLASALRLLARKELSAAELNEAVLARINRLNAEMRAFITVLPNEAGCPVSVKDL